MTRFIIVSITSGILYGVFDALINANPLARKLYKPLEPIMKTSVNVVAGIIIDLFFGFVMAGLFLLLYSSLPGESGLLKGAAFGFIVWLFRVLMSVLSQWVMFNLPPSMLIYTLGSGMVEMLVLGLIYGTFLKP
jgi:hypothetical protein